MLLLMMEQKKSFFSRLKTNRQTQITVGLIALGIVFILGFFFYSIFINNNQDKKSDEIAQDGQGDRVYRKIDGIEVMDGKINEFPVAVMIENLKSVRPQAGLSKASIVYEALAEGGITRLMGVFVEEDIQEIGPVRSARPYFIPFVLEYDALYAHAGGSPEALQKIKADGVKSINQVAGDHEYYFRDKNLFAPHNLFTKSDLLSFALRDYKLIDLKPDYEGWEFEEEAVDANRPSEEKSVTIPFSSQDYEVTFNYNRDKNVYERSNGGLPHIDKNTGEQLTAKNVIVLYIESKVLDNEGRLELKVLGEGKAILFKNGQAVTGTWKKKADEERTIFSDSQGEEYVFARGNIFVELVPADKEIIFN